MAGVESISTPACHLKQSRRDSLKKLRAARSDNTPSEVDVDWRADANQMYYNPAAGQRRSRGEISQLGSF
jgi:hypothetical protein